MKARRRIRRYAASSEPHADLLTRILTHRGLSSCASLDYGLRDLTPVSALSGVEQATQLLGEATRGGKRILVIGDFDADGATSTALAIRALRSMGARDVAYLVPNRFEYGYGLTPEIVAVARRLQPDLLVTVDNGVSSLEGVEAARGAGMRVLVTDHHLPGTRLPDADAIVNPNLPGDDFPSKNLAGVGVIFYVMLALRAHLRACGWFEAGHRPEPNLAGLLDLVALGTVADVVTLDHNNRILVEQGLRRMRAGQTVPGIGALVQVSGRNPARLVAADLGFALGPRLNAAGRLDDMSLGIECLLTDDPVRALELARSLDDLNRDRREIEGQMQAQAVAALGELPAAVDGEHRFHGLCLYQPDWHQGVIGILASRIKERVHRPVIAFADAGEDVLKGSARSIPGLHIRDALDAIAAGHPGMITRFGGHAMAAGLSLPKAHLEDFRSAFDEAVRARIAPDDLQGVIHSDGVLDPSELSLETAERLRAAGPWGQGFPEPIFDGRFEILDRRIVADRHLRLVLRPEGGSSPVTGIAFNIDAADWPEDCRNVHLAYRLDVNEYRGILSPQVVVVEKGAVEP